jgi:phage shock protein A
VAENHKSCFIPDLYTGEDVMNTAQYEERIAGLEQAATAQSEQNASLTAALELLKAELAETTRQRDAYKAYVDKMLADAPSFDE